MFTIDSDNYPAGANDWNGTPKRVMPNGRYLTPGTLLDAQVLNAMIGAAADAGNGGGASAAQAWHGRLAASATTGYSGLTGINWSPISGFFYLSASVSSGTGNANVFFGFGAGDVDDFINAVDNGTGITVGGVIHDSIWDGTKNICAFVDHASSHLNLYACSPGGAWSGTLTNTSFAYTNARMYLFGGAVLAFAAASGGAVLESTTNHGSTWTFDTGFNTAMTGSSVALLVADNGTTMVVIPSVAASSSQHYVTGTPGSWTQHNLGGLNNSTLPIGLAYDPTTGLFILACNHSNLETYTSPDGITWTLVSTTTTYPGAEGMVCLANGLLVAITNDTGGGSWVIMSADAGKTWRRTQAFLPTVASPLTLAKIACSPTSLAVMNMSWVKMSSGAGLPAAFT